MRVLDLGAGESCAARVLWPEAEVVAVDARPIAHLVGGDGPGDDRVTRVVGDVRALPEDLGEFEVILASHVLEHLTRAEVVPALAHWASHLMPAGELHVLVPDLAWAAERVVRGEMAVEVQATIYGSQDNEYQFHKVGFTVALLRDAVRRAGLVVRTARLGPFEIENTWGDGRKEVVVARQIYVVGVKRDPSTGSG
jgi:trans-aconitate methyltransferase